MRKILQVIPFFTPSRGGSVIVPYNLSKELSQRGYSVTIATTNFEFNTNFARSINEAIIIPFDCKANLGLFIFSPDMENWLKENLESFDIIHLHNYRSYQNYLIYKWATNYGIPYVVQAHGSLPRIFNMQTLKLFYDHIWGYRILKNATRVIALTEIEKQQYVSMGVAVENIELIPNGIDIHFCSIAKKGKFRKKYSFSEEDKIILFLGRLNKIKGLSLLISAFRDICKLNDMYKLVIIGPDDGYGRELKKEIVNSGLSNYVMLIDGLYGEEKVEAYLDADVYVLPSIYETFPMSVLESLSCGTPVILTDNCEISSLIDGKAGIAVKYDKMQLKQAILKILNDDVLRSNYSITGIHLVRELFSEEIILNKYEALYEKLSYTGKR